ncbi:MAG: hypothetical protein IPG08_16925 [Sphingobacteriaceae bacterium]|nr:hypothetical protein [Sphingobacteriaceae bacterium]
MENSYLTPLSLSKGYELEFIYANAYCYHLELNYKKCIFWLGKLFHEKCDRVFKQSILLESFLLYISTHWIIGNKDLMLSLFNSNEHLLSNYLINKNFLEVKRIAYELSKADSKHGLKKYFKENPPNFIELEDNEKGVSFSFSVWLNSI